ncbi:MAG: RIP metalloprotease RseP [Candidatus Brocadiia bacterium]|nr:RIP metalloprotease RseP [Candidatus Brocadiia bacterium]
MLAMIFHILLAIAAVSVVIIVHEIGHLLMAKAVGVRVEVFSIGFWKKIVAFRRGDTEYRLSLVPFGGYIKMAGELVGEGSGAPDEFSSKTPGQRALVFVAGVSANIVFALVAFIIAFTIGVPFEVAEIGELERGLPAWKAGLRVGDRIVQLDDLRDPDFEDVLRTVALGGKEDVHVIVERAAQEITYAVEVEYDKRLGLRRLGFRVPVEPVITQLSEAGEGETRWPAREAGLRLNDRVVAVDGKRVASAQQMMGLLGKVKGLDVELTVERKDGEYTFAVHAEPKRRLLIGISGDSTIIKAVQNDGPAERMGLQKGDRIVRVGDRPVGSVIDLDEAIRARDGRVAMTVERNGDEFPIEGEVPDEQAVGELLFSVQFESSNKLAWVNAEGAAWEAGMRPGDVIVAINDEEVESWEDVLRENGRNGSEARTVRWLRGGKKFAKSVTPRPVIEEGGLDLGLAFTRPKMRTRRYSIAESVGVGLRKTVGEVKGVFVMLRSIGKGQVSPRNVGSIGSIAVVTYRAAKYGPGKLLYWAAMLSTIIAVVNILPIPVLDGGHLAFVAMEKMRGRPVSERVMLVSQYAGLSLLVAVMAYALRNDVLRFFFRN